MGKVGKGILGGWRNRVGTVIGYSWRSIECMRSMPNFVHNPQTAEQMRARYELRAVSQKTSDFGAANLEFWFKPYAVKMSGFNAAVKYIFKNAANLAGQNTTLRYANIVPGSDPIFVSTAITINASGIQISYDLAQTPDAELEITNPPSLIVLNIDKSEVYSNLTGLDDFDTSGGTLSNISLPAHWTGDTIEVYFFQRRVDGTKLFKTVHQQLTVV